MKMAKNDTTPLAKGKVILTHAKRPAVALMFLLRLLNGSCRRR
jgi:hypothetical protein